MAKKRYAPLLSLPRSAYQELAAIASHANSLQEIVDESSKFGPYPNFDDFTEDLIPLFPDMNSTDLALVLTGLANLRRSVEKINSDLDDVFESIVSTTYDRGTPAWVEENHSVLKDQIGIIKAVVLGIDPNHNLSITRKARELCYKHEKTLTSSQVITDLRPIFDEAGLKICESIVTQKLVLEYYDGEHKTSEIAMDLSDVHKLRTWCERAIIKSETLMRELGSSGWPTHVIDPENQNG